MNPIGLRVTSGLKGTATFSKCGRYRYILERRIPNVIGPKLTWLMLNPSIACANADDPTIRKVINFTARNGYGTAIVVNLFAFCATDPKECRASLIIAEGDHNAEAVHFATDSSENVVCAWGAAAWARPQAARASCSPR